MRKGAAERFRGIRCNGADQFVIFAVAKSIFRCRPVAGLFLMKVFYEHNGWDNYGMRSVPWELY